MQPPDQVGVGRVAPQVAGERGEELRRELHQARHRLEDKLGSTGDELKSCWQSWDALLAQGDSVAPGERRRVLEQMLGVVHRRRYLDHLISEIATTLAE